MSPSEIESTRLPPQRVGVVDGRTVSAWHAQVQTLSVEPLADGGRELSWRGGCGSFGHVMRLPPDACAALAAMLVEPEARA